jgi:hypothetical protein
MVLRNFLEAFELRGNSESTHNPNVEFHRLCLLRQLLACLRFLASHFSLASDFRILNSLHIVSLTPTFSFSYFDLRLLSATSAVFLFDLSTLRSVAICSRFVDSKDLSFMIYSWRSAISSLDSLSAAEKSQKLVKLHLKPLKTPFSPFRDLVLV